MKIFYKHGLLFTDIEITYNAKTKIVRDIVIDTGAAASIISPDIVEDMDVYPEADDRIVTFIGVGGSEHHSFVKKVDEIKVGEFVINNIEVDFGIVDPKGKINGLLGLDILIKMGVVIDLKEISIT